MHILSVYSGISATSVPIESFLEIRDPGVTLSVASFYQSPEEAKGFVDQVYPGVNVNVYGIGFAKNYFGILIRSVKLLMNIHPDIVHVHHAFSGAVVALLTRLFTRTQVMVTLHNEFGSHKTIQKIFILITMCCSRVVVCNSKSTLKSVGIWRKTLLRRKRFVVCYNGVNNVHIEKLTHEKQQPKFRVDNKHFVVGHVGRLVTQKDVPTLLTGFAVFHKQCPEARLVLVGDGVLRQQLEKMAVTLGIDHVTKFLGAISRKDVYHFLSEVDLVVVGSRWEGFCNAMVEAMFASKPVIASDIDVLIEVLGKDHGRFFETGEATCLAQILTEMYDQPALRAELGRGLQNRAKSRYTLQAAAQGYLSCYHELMETS